MTDIITYLCPKDGHRFDGIDVVDACDMPAADPPVVFLRPSGTFSVDVSIMPDPGCVGDALAAMGGVCLSCERGVEFNHNNEFSARKTFLTFFWSNFPDDFCGVCAWKGTTITRRNLVTLTDGAFLASVPVVPNSGFIPNDDDHHHNVSQFGTINLTGPECVPGEQVRLSWNLLIGGDIQSRQVAAFVFDMPAVTGGRVTDVTGDMTIGRQIKVAFFDWGELTLTPTDFADYQVGSWVFALRVGRSEAAAVNRQTAFELGSRYESTEALSDILTLVNVERTSRGLAALVRNSALDEAAVRHADDMADNDFLSHTGSDGSSSFDRIDAAGYLFGLPDDGGYKTGENVAVGSTSAAMVVDRWMKSPGHRANILDSVFAEIGIAYAETATGKPFYVQDFGWRSDFEQTATVVESYRPVPLTINAAQNSGLVNTSGFSPIDLSLVNRFETDFETAYCVGVINAVDGAAVTADVTVEQFGSTRFNDVPIHYHCPDRSDVLSGHKAFTAGDSVLVLNEGGHKTTPDAADLTVVGFADARLKACFDCVVLFRLHYVNDATGLDDYKYLFVEVKDYDDYVVYPVYDGAGNVIAQPFWGSARNPATVAADNGLTATATKSTGGCFGSFNMSTTHVGPSSYNYRFNFYDPATGLLLDSETHDPRGVYNNVEFGHFKCQTSLVLPSDGTWLFDPGEPRCKLNYSVVYNWDGAKQIHIVETAFGSLNPTTPQALFTGPFLPADSNWFPVSYHTSVIWSSFNDTVGGCSPSELFYGGKVALFHYKRREIMKHYIIPTAPQVDDYKAFTESAFYFQFGNPDPVGDYQFRWSEFLNMTLTEDAVYDLFGTTKAAYESTDADWGLINGASMIDQTDAAVSDFYDTFGIQIYQTYI